MRPTADGEHLVRSYPLQNRIVAKTLAERLERNPESGEPHRWVGWLRHLQQAFAIDTNGQIAGRKLIVGILSQVAHSTRELFRRYLGNPQKDRLALMQATSRLECVSERTTATQSFGRPKRTDGSYRNLPQPPKPLSWALPSYFDRYRAERERPTTPDATHIGGSETI